MAASSFFVFFNKCKSCRVPGTENHPRRSNGGSAKEIPAALFQSLFRPAPETRSGLELRGYILESADARLPTLRGTSFPGTRKRTAKHCYDSVGSD